MAMNMPIVPGGDIPYSDTPEPKVYGHVSPLDPQLFSTVADHAGDVMAGRANGKYSPAEVAGWLDGFTAASEKALAGARKSAGANVAFRRLDEDTRIVNGMGRFYAAKLRAALLYEIWLATRDHNAGALALGFYKKGRDAWAAMVERAKKIYVADVSYGSVPMRRGHWADRLAGIDKDIDAMRTAIAAGGPRNRDASAVIAKATQAYRHPSVPCRHAVPAAFRPGAPLSLSLAAEGQGLSARLFYRHVNQAERWRDMAMAAEQARISPPPSRRTTPPRPIRCNITSNCRGAMLRGCTPRSMRPFPTSPITRSGSGRLESKRHQDSPRKSKCCRAAKRRLPLVRARALCNPCRQKASGEEL